MGIGNLWLMMMMIGIGRCILISILVSCMLVLLQVLYLSHRLDRSNRPLFFSSYRNIRKRFDLDRFSFSNGLL